MTTKITTPAGRLVWPKIQVADCYREEGQMPSESDKYYYSTKLVLDPDDEKVAVFLQKLEQIAQGLADEESNKGKKKAPHKDPLYSCKPETDQDGNETGMMVLSVRALARGTKDGKAWERKVPILDHNNETFESEGKTLGNGTIAKVSIEPRSYRSGGIVGVTLQLRAVKVLAPKFFDVGAESDFDDDEVTAEEFEKIQENYGTSGDF